MQNDESEDPLDSDDENAYMWTVFSEFHHTDVLVNGTFKCPFDEKPRDGEKDTLIEHAIATSVYGDTRRTRAKHMALKIYMMGPTSHQEGPHKEENYLLKSEIELLKDQVAGMKNLRNAQAEVMKGRKKEWDEEREALKKDKSKLEYMIYDLIKAGGGNKEKMKRIKEICGE